MIDIFQMNSHCPREHAMYRIAGFCRENFNLAIALIHDIKIRDYFIHDILYLVLYWSRKFLVARAHAKMLFTTVAS